MNTVKAYFKKVTIISTVFSAVIISYAPISQATDDPREVSSIFSNQQLVGLAGKCMDVKGNTAANGTPIILWPCHQGGNQKWTYYSDGTIRGLSGKCLDVKGNNPANGTSVILWPCNGGVNQKWSFRSNSTIRGLAGKCLDVKGNSSTDGTPLILWPCHGGANQQWSEPLI